MLNQLHKTGPYLHAPDDLVRIRFETGGTPRLFTALIATAIERDQIDFSGAGITILDEDEGRVVLDRHFPAVSDQIGEELTRIRSLGWIDFSAFCRSHERFRPWAEDLREEQVTPSPGSRKRQAALTPPIHASGSALDLRSDNMIAADLDPTSSVRFPAADRSRMVSDLMTRITNIQDGTGAVLAWEARFPSLPDLSGLSGPYMTDRSLDLAWNERLERQPELLEEARLSILTPLVSGSVRTWGAEDEGRYDLRAVPQTVPMIGLYALDDRPLRLDRSEDLQTLLSGAPDRLVRDLWKLDRTLCAALSPDKLGTDLGLALNRIRSETELAREAEPSPFGP